MAPQHDEVLKRDRDGYIVAWDTTRTSKSKRDRVQRVAKRHSDLLGKIIDSDRSESSRGGEQSAR